MKKTKKLFFFNQKVCWCCLLADLYVFLPVTAWYLPSVPKKPRRRWQQPPAHIRTPRSTLHQDRATGEAGELRNGPINSTSVAVFKRCTSHLWPHRVLLNKIHYMHHSHNIKLQLSLDSCISAEDLYALYTTVLFTIFNLLYTHLQFTEKMRCPSRYTALWGGFLNDWLWCHELITAELPAVVKMMGVHRVMK